MWKDHFEKLYNSVNVSEARDKFMTQMSNAVNQEYTIHVSDVIDAISKQKKGKAAGIDGVHMEAFIYGCNRLFVHISILDVTNAVTTKPTCKEYGTMIMEVRR